MLENPEKESLHCYLPKIFRKRKLTLYYIAIMLEDPEKIACIAIMLENPEYESLHCYHAR